MFQKLITFFAMYRSLLGDKRTPTRAKVLPWAALLYLIVPVDMIPDFLPLLGQLDDITIIVILLSIAMNAVSKTQYDEYARRKNVIDVTPRP